MPRVLLWRSPVWPRLAARTAADQGLPGKDMARASRAYRGLGLRVLLGIGLVLGIAEATKGLCRKT